MVLEDFFENYFKMERAYRRFYHSEMEKYHLSPNELLVMLFLARGDRSSDTARDIASYEGVSKALVARSVESLSEKGYIRIERDSGDRRVCHLYLTESSDEIIHIITGKQQAFFDRMTSGIADENIAVVQSVINRFMENISNMESGL